MMLTGGNKYWEKNLSRRYCVQNKSHIKWPGIEHLTNKNYPELYTIYSPYRVVNTPSQLYKPIS